MIDYVIDKEYPYSYGGYVMKAIPTPENRTPKDVADTLYIKAIQNLSDGKAEEGRRGLELSYELGDLDSGNTLAYGYDSGWFGRPDYQKALALYRALVRKLHRTAMRNYANCLLLGVGTRKDHEQGLYWLREAADRGDAVAMANVASLLAFGDVHPHDYKRAKSYVVKSVEAGCPEGANTLARMYEVGVCYRQNPKKAFQWYNAACQGEKNPVFLRNLAQCYKHGIGVEMDEAMAADLRKQANVMDR